MVSVCFCNVRMLAMRGTPRLRYLEVPSSAVPISQVSQAPIVTSTGVRLPMSKWWMNASRWCNGSLEEFVVAFVHKSIYFCFSFDVSFIVERTVNSAQHSICNG